MLEDIYSKKIYNNIGNPEVLSCVPAYAKKILDIGCGAGDNAKILKSLGKYVVGLTISSSEALIAEKICDEIIQANIENAGVTIDGEFDCIIMSHICEHLINPEEVIKKLISNLSSKGILIVAVPNMAYYKLRVRLLKGNWKMEESGPFDKTHLHFYSFYTAPSVYSGSELTLVQQIPGQLSLPLWPLRKILPGLCKKLDAKLGQGVPNLFSIQTILVFEKKI